MKLLTGYKSYKKTTSLFLNELPLNWQLVKLKYVANIYNGNSLNDDYKQLFESDNKDEIPYIASKDINVETLEINYQNGTRIPYNFENLKIAPSNSALLCIEGGSAGRKMAFTNQDVYFVNKLACFNTENKVTSKFIFYNLQGDYFQSQFSNSITGLIGGVSITNIRNFNIPLPTIEEQLAINNYLDYQTTLINDIINRKVKQIELLKEKRQAIINETVTKGLNPDAKMKDSGIEWLGEIPEHWDIKKMKNIATITRGAILRPVDAPEYFDDNGEWTYLNISDATKCDKYLHEGKLRLSELGSTKSARVYPNNLILTASATIGKPFINKIPVCVHDGFIPFTEIKCNIDYLYHFLGNPQLYVALGKSNTQKNIYLDEVKNMFVTQPPIEEQIEITNFLEHFELKHREIIEKLNIQIQKLKEYRQSIISEAVTGKIDVRDWQPNNSSN